MKQVLLTCVILLSLGYTSFGQVSADPAIGTVTFTTLANAPLSSGSLPGGTGFKINVQFFNNPANPPTPGAALPAGSCKLKIGLGSKLGINPGFDVSTAPYSQYFSWTVAFNGQWEITGDLIADLPGNFNGTAVFELKSTNSGNSTISVNFLASNHNTSITLSDSDPTNNNTLVPYTIVSSLSIAINQGSSITVCQNSTLTLTTTVTNGTAPFNYSWTGGLGTSSSASVPTTTPGTTTYTVTVTDASSNTANASITVTISGPNNITASAGANGVISSPGITSVPCGTNKTYTITPNGCYHVQDVLVDGLSQGAITTYTFTNVVAAHTISATFAIDTYTITVTPGANGTITPGTGTVNCGSNNTYTITPAACYHIVDVKLDGISQGAVTTLPVNNVSANHTITATFAIDTYNITVTPGANGTITPGTGTVNCGSNNTYTITPAACYHIVDVKLDGISQGAVTTLPVNNVSASHTITATFAIDTYNITVTPGANGTITPGTGTVNCGSNNTYTITPATCYHIVDVKLDGISQGTVTTLPVNNVTANHTITATFAIDTYNITVTPGANGTITPGTGTVNCGSNNTYTITPAACYHIVDVKLDGVSQGAVTTLPVNNVSANHTITATFAIDTYNITVTPGANGTITPGTGTVNCGSNNTYTITPDPCYHIVDVKLDGISQGAVTTLPVNNVSANHTITATFAIDTYNITVTPGANGTITPGTGTVNCGSNNTYTITPATCYHIVDVKLDGISQGAVTTLPVNNVSANHTITATFAIDTYNITVTPGANGTITPGTGTVNCGSNNTYTITPDPCYQIVDVTLDGISQGAVTTLPVNNVSASHTITATFAIDTYTITVTPGANGTITPGTGTVNCGSNNTYTITPDPCYHIVDVKLDGISQGAVTTLPVNNVTANHTITATFAIDTYNITVTPGANGTITPGTGTVNCGSNNTYTITPDPCYQIVDVTLDGISQGAVTTLPVNNVTANHTITATFAIDTYTITVTPGANGTITPGTGTVNCGSNNTYTITADPCYHIADVKLDGISQGAVTTLPVNNVTANHTITATFAIDTYNITVTPGANGTITPGTGTVNCGSNNTYTITPDPCYHIVDVKLDGISQGAVTTLPVNNVSANHTITATFAIDTYLITVTPGANGTITPGTGTVNCGSNNTYTITPDPCYQIVDVTLDGISQGAVTTLPVNNVSANHTITATFAIDTYTITVTPGANGTITPGTGTVNCGSNNTYTITADPCYHIADVKLDGISQGAVTTLPVNNVSASHTITATFAIDTYNITVTPGANGTITPGTGTVNCGSNNTYTITADPCYHIVDVTLDGVSQGAVTTLPVNNVSANHTITATFAVNGPYTITVTPGANGTITPGTGTVNCGSNNTYTVTADPCYHIMDVTLDGISQGAVTTLPVNNVSANHLITATFALNGPFTITATAGSNGTITPAGATSVNCGGSQSYSFTADPGYHILDVFVDGISQGALSSYNFTNLQGNRSIHVTFALDATYTISASAGANGTVSPAGNSSVSSGGSLAYTITPDPCYHIVDVLVDGVSQGPVSTYNFTGVVSDHTISATFAVDTYTITVTPGANGTITPGTGTVNCGSNNIYTITADPCYHVVDVTLDGLSQGAITSLPVNNVSANHTITATFAVNGPYTITVTPGANGTITPGTGTVGCGSNNIYTITPAACYHITDVTLDGISQGPVTTLPLNNVTANHTITASFAADIIPVPTVMVTNNCNGTSTLTASDFTGTLLWSDGGLDNPHVVSIAGSYTVTQTIGSCTSAASAPVMAAPVMVAAPTVTVTQPTCISASGTITITAPVAAGMTYSIDGMTYTNSTGVFTGLVPGSYNVTAKTSGGCTSPVTVSTVNAVPGSAGISVSQVVNNTCHGGSAGSVTVVGSGATGPYTYSILSGPTVNTTGQSTGIFTGLAAGNYVFQVTPAAGCANTVAATVAEPTGISPDISMGADYDNNFFAANGVQNNLLYNISEIGGNPAIGDTLRIIRVPGYDFIFDNAATTFTLGQTFTLDNSRWKLDNSNPAFILLILDPGNTGNPGVMNCSQTIYIKLGFKRNTPNRSTFSLTARLKKADNELRVNNNVFPVVFTAD